MKIAILGVTGYTGQILMRLLASHPAVETIYPVSSSQVGSLLTDNDPGLSDSIAARLPGGDLRLLDIKDAVAAKPDLVFAALPHLKSAEICGPFFATSVVIDLSADFRIKDHAAFSQAYGIAPPRPDLLQQAVYGLSEFNRQAIAHADLIANPGCYPTATMLGLGPLLKAGLIEGDIIVNALSGVSGAGRKAAEAYLFCSRSENVNAYAPGKSHRHQAEMWQEVCTHAGTKSQGLDLWFTPHLVPIKQGMQVSSTFKLKAGTKDEQIDSAFKTAYQNEAFVRIRSSMPQTAHVRGSNRCDVYWQRDGDRLFVFTVIDNLIKGASGQAVQNMNIRFGLPETSGLSMQGEVL